MHFFAFFSILPQRPTPCSLATNPCRSATTKQTATFAWWCMLLAAWAICDALLWSVPTLFSSAVRCMPGTRSQVSSQLQCCTSFAMLCIHHYHQDQHHRQHTYIYIYARQLRMRMRVVDSIVPSLYSHIGRQTRSKAAANFPRFFKRLISVKFGRKKMFHKFCLNLYIYIYLCVWVFICYIDCKPTHLTPNCSIF